MRALMLWKAIQNWSHARSDRKSHVVSSHRLLASYLRMLSLASSLVATKLTNWLRRCDQVGCDAFFSAHEGPPHTRKIKTGSHHTSIDSAVQQQQQQAIAGGRRRRRRTGGPESKPQKRASNKRAGGWLPSRDILNIKI